jgi:hypothetical protein
MRKTTYPHRHTLAQHPSRHSVLPLFLSPRPINPLPPQILQCLHLRRPRLLAQAPQHHDELRRKRRRKVERLVVQRVESHGGGLDRWDVRFLARGFVFGSFLALATLSASFRSFLAALRRVGGGSPILGVASCFAGVFPPCPGGRG